MRNGLQLDKLTFFIFILPYVLPNWDLYRVRVRDALAILRVDLDVCV